MAELLGILLPLTLDSGAQVTVVPEEAVKDSEFTGETTKCNGIVNEGYLGRLANITLQIGGESFHREEVAVPGQDIAWTADMSVNLDDMQELQKVHHQIHLSNKLPEEETHSFRHAWRRELYEAL